MDDVLKEDRRLLYRVDFLFQDFHVLTGRVLMRQYNAYDYGLFMISFMEKHDNERELNYMVSSSTEKNSFKYKHEL